jgi:hypothetical protein
MWGWLCRLHTPASNFAKKIQAGPVLGSAAKNLLEDSETVTASGARQSPCRRWRLLPRGEPGQASIAKTAPFSR